MNVPSEGSAFLEVAGSLLEDDASAEGSLEEDASTDASLEVFDAAEELDIAEVFSTVFVQPPKIRESKPKELTVTKRRRSCGRCIQSVSAFSETTLFMQFKTFRD
jgi:hypothetical protein